MSPVIRISETIYKRLESKAKGFDTPSNVIERLLDFYEKNTSSNINLLEKDSTRNILDSREVFYSLNQLRNKNLIGEKPKSIIMGEESFETRSWADLCVKFTHWLFENGYLDKSNLPIPNSARNKKYFINSLPEHSSERYDGDWRKVDEYLYVDIKYNTEAHIKNILSTLDYLDIDNEIMKVQLTTIS